MKHHITKILYIQFVSFGDVLVSTQIIRKLKEKHPNSEIHYYTTTPCVPLLMKNPDISFVFTERYPPASFEFYDVVLRPYRALQMSGGWHLSGKHFMDIYAEICGVDLEKDYFGYFYNIEEFKIPYSKYILIQCKTNDSAKDYDRFGELVSQINKKIKLPVIQIGSPTDPIIEGAAEFLPLPWPKTAYLVSKAVTTVCLDSAVQHLACALNAPHIALYGPKDKEMVQSSKRILFEYQYGLEPENRNGCKVPCNLAVCQNPLGKCINNISPEWIIELIDKTMQGE